MALLDLTESWVGVSRRLDGDVRHPDWYPKAYVRLDLNNVEGVSNMSAASARKLAKALNANANLIDPPTPRVKRS